MLARLPLATAAPDHRRTVARAVPGHSHRMGLLAVWWERPSCPLREVARRRSTERSGRRRPTGRRPRVGRNTGPHPSTAHPRRGGRLPMARRKAGRRNTVHRAGRRNTVHRAGRRNTVHRAGRRNTVHSAGRRNTVRRAGRRTEGPVERLTARHPTSPRRRAWAGGRTAARRLRTRLRRRRPLSRPTRRPWRLMGGVRLRRARPMGERGLRGAIH
jgi:hypothetical protein